MDAILSFLSGKKTYLLNGLALLLVGCWMFGVVDNETAMKGLIALGFGSQITLRAGMAKTEAKADEAVQKVAALQRGDKPYIG